MFALQAQLVSVTGIGSGFRHWNLEVAPPQHDCKQVGLQVGRLQVRVCFNGPHTIGASTLRTSIMPSRVPYYKYIR